MLKVSDINIIQNVTLPGPQQMRDLVPKTDEHRKFVQESRNQIHNILFGNDPRLLMIVGPCSIHDTMAGLKYAEKLAALSEKVSDRILIVMRAYFEKPRTSTGWKGLIMDPNLDDSCDIPEGLKNARSFLRSIIDLKLPTATELLDPITPQYIADLISWSCIGARTTESQTHRQMASGLSMPLGFKNSTDGTVTAAVNAIKAASQRQTFLGIDENGTASAVTTRGNPNCHVVLRGGANGPNYSPEHVARVAEELKKNNLIPSVLIDCSHGNSEKDYKRQPEVFKIVLEQALNPNSPVIGAMLESNIGEGNQAFPQPVASLKRGISITDACIGWDTTEQIILDAHEQLASISTV